MAQDPRRFTSPVPTMGKEADRSSKTDSDIPMISISNSLPPPGRASPRHDEDEAHCAEPAPAEQASKGGIMRTVAAAFSWEIGRSGQAGTHDAIRRATNGTYRRASKVVADEQKRCCEAGTPYERRRTTSSNRRTSAMITSCDASCCNHLQTYAEEKNIPAQSKIFGIGDVNGTDTMIGQAPVEEREITFPGKQDMVNAVSEAVALGHWADAATALAALKTATEQACRVEEAAHDIAAEDREINNGICSQIWRGFIHLVEEFLVAMIVRFSMLVKMLMYCLYIVPPAMATGLACSALLFALGECIKIRDGKCAVSGLGEQEEYEAPAQLLGGVVSSFIGETGIFGEWMGVSETIEVTTAKTTPLYGCQRVVDSHRWMIYLLPFGGMLSAQLFKWFDVGSKPNFLRKDGKETAAAGGSSGTLFQGLEGTHHIPLRMTPLVWIGTVITHAFGGSAGREGTGVQMAASITSSWCQHLNWAFAKCGITGRMNPFKDHGFVKALMISSVGAGFAGIFGTPMTGGIFALEVMTVGQVEYQAIFPAIFASIIADYTCRGSNHWIFGKDLHTEYFCAKCAGHKWPQVAETGDIATWTWSSSEESIGSKKYGALSGTCGTNTTGSNCSALPEGLTQAQIDSAKFKGIEGEGRYETGSWFKSESKKFERNGPPSAFYYMPFAPKQFFNAEDIVEHVQLANPQAFGVWGQHEPFMLVKIFFSSIFFGLCGSLFAELIEVFKAFYDWLLPKAKCEFKGWNFQYLAKPFVGGWVVVLLWMLLSAKDNPFDFPSEYCGKRKGNCNGLPSYKYGDSYLGLGTHTVGLSISTMFDADGVDFFTFLFKTIITCLTLACGFKGGEVTPIFFIGAAAGNTAAYVWGEDAELFAALGLCATFAAATNTPMACVIMGFELFGGMTPLYFGEACFVAYLFSGNSGIYIKQFIAKASKSIAGDLLSEGDIRGTVSIENQGHAPDIKGLVNMLSPKHTHEKEGEKDLIENI